jgi:NAD(P)-dependent dehydrogenase (short-subunit alcohol dehydrogenase family)
MGSITQVERYKFAPTPAYKITKAALNMLTAQYAQDFAEEGVTFLAISPGVSHDLLLAPTTSKINEKANFLWGTQWLKTDMGSQAADLEVDVGAKEIVRLIHENGIESSGKFLNIRVAGWEGKYPNSYEGGNPPW